MPGTSDGSCTTYTARDFFVPASVRSKPEPSSRRTRSAIGDLPGRMTVAGGCVVPAEPARRARGGRRGAGRRPRGRRTCRAGSPRRSCGPRAVAAAGRTSSAPRSRRPSPMRRHGRPRARGGIPPARRPRAARAPRHGLTGRRTPAPGSDGISGIDPARPHRRRVPAPPARSGRSPGQRFRRRLSPQPRSPRPNESTIARRLRPFTPEGQAADVDVAARRAPRGDIPAACPRRATRDATDRQPFASFRGSSGPFNSANLGYSVEGALNGRGLATAGSAGWSGRRAMSWDCIACRPRCCRATPGRAARAQAKRIRADRVRSALPDDRGPCQARPVQVLLHD